nr:hypothetical protein [Tanacetum cinerariifolium]
MLPVTQIDTFYNGLTLRHRDTINTAAEIVALKAEMAEINKNLMRVRQVNQQVKAVNPNYETCGGPHSYNDCPAIVGQTQNVYATGAYQGGNSYQPQSNRNLLSYRSDNYLGPLGFHQNQNRNNQNPNFQKQNRNQGNNHPQGNNQGRNQFFHGASHGQNPPPVYQAPAYQASGYQALVHQPSIPQPQVVTTTEFTNYMKANNAILKNIQTNMTSLTNFNLELKNIFGHFKTNTASSSGSGTLLSNTITNPKEDLKGITTRSGTAYQGPTIPTTSYSLPKVVERETEVTKDTVLTTNKGSTKDAQPPVVQIETLIPNYKPIVAPVAEPIVAPVSAPKPNKKSSIPYPSRLHDQKLSGKANDQKEKFFQIFKDLDFNINFADALILTPKFGSTIKSLLTNKDKLYELARTPLNDHCSAVLLKKLPKKLGDPGELTLRVGKEAITFYLDQTSRYSANYNDMTTNRIDVIDMACEEYSQEFLDFSNVIASGNPTPYYDPVVSTSSPTLTPFGDSYFLLEEELKICEAKNDKSLIDEPSKVKLKELPPHLEDLSVKEKSALIKVLKSHKQAIAWKLFDIKGINPEFCTHKIIMEDDFEPAVKHQRRVNPKIHDVIKKETRKFQFLKVVLSQELNHIWRLTRLFLDACPNACEMWKAIERLKQGESINVQDLKTNLYWDFAKFTLHDGESLESYYSRMAKHPFEVNEIKAERIARVANPLALVAQQHPVYHPQNHPTQYTQNSLTRSQQAATRNKEKAIVNSPQPIYDQEPSMVVEDDEISKNKEIDKLMALISLSFKKIYKPTNNNLRTSSNTSRTNQDNSLRINRSTGYENQRIGKVAGAKETVGSTV